jgi:hypothetical protein
MLILCGSAMSFIEKENIKQNILVRGNVLYNEVEFLMRQELRETSTYNTLIETIAMGNTKLNDIYQKTQIERAKISVYIKNLMDLLIEKLADNYKKSCHFLYCLHLSMNNIISISNIVIILSTWAVIKVPMLLNESKFLGTKIMFNRWVLTTV